MFAEQTVWGKGPFPLHPAKNLSLPKVQEKERFLIPQTLFGMTR
jgi:hypothetical protein